MLQQVWVSVIVEDLNQFLRGWANYYRYGHSARRFGKIQQHAQDRLALFIGKRHKRGRGFGMSVLADRSTDKCGQPERNRHRTQGHQPWREKPNAGGERRR